MGEELQSLLDKINADGIQKAEAEAARIIEAARREADAVLSSAKAESSVIIAKAEAEADSFKQRALSTTRQAARDIALQLRSELAGRLNAAIKGATAAAMTPEFMAQLIRELAASFASAPESELNIRTALKDVSALDAALKGALADSLKKTPVVFGDSELAGGVQLEFNDSDCYFDFSDAAVNELLSGYAGEQLAAVFKAD